MGSFALLTLITLSHSFLPDWLGVCARGGGGGGDGGGGVHKKHTKESRTAAETVCAAEDKQTVEPALHLFDPLPSPPR